MRAIGLANGLRGGLPLVSRVPSNAPAPMRPGELARAKARLHHAAKGHRECAAWHKAQAAMSADTAPASPEAMHKADADWHEPPAILSAAELDTHARMAEVHEKAAAELEAKAESLK